MNRLVGTVDNTGILDFVHGQLSRTTELGGVAVTAILNDDFHGFHQSLQPNAGIAPRFT
jgi:hypothetical protein